MHELKINAKEMFISYLFFSYQTLTGNVLSSIESVPVNMSTCWFDNATRRGALQDLYEKIFHASFTQQFSGSFADSMTIILMQNTNSSADI